MDATQEQWRAVVGWESLYEVSDRGNLRSLDRWMVDAIGRRRHFRGQPLKPHIGARDYWHVVLTRNGRSRYIKVHQLVAEAFLGPRPNGHIVLHWDDVKSNNQASNLRYGTHSDNQYDRVRNGNHYNAEKTHCAHGHAFTPDNTMPRSGRGGRKCRECHRAEGRARAEANRRAAGIPTRALLTHCKRGHEFTAENTYLNPASGARVCRKCNLLHQQRSQPRRMK